MNTKKEIAITELKLMSCKLDIMEYDSKMAKLKEILEEVKINESAENIEKFETLSNNINEIGLRINEKLSEANLINKLIRKNMKGE